MTGCRIGKVKMKSGGAEIRVFERPARDVAEVELPPWGRVTLECFDKDGPLANKDVIYMLEMAKAKVIKGLME